MSNNIDWSDAIKKEARGVNGEDLGEVQHVEKGYVLVQKGMINKEKFYIPQDKAVDYDGSVVRFSISEEEIKSQYTEMGSSYQADTTTSAYQGESTTTEGQTDETTVQLTEEKLDVSKTEQEDQVRVTKVPQTRTETKEVPVTHEEISIERRQPFDQTTTQSPTTSTEEIEIPVKREEVEVTKTPYVKEEVAIKKKPVTETQTVTEEVTSEDVSTSGNV